MKKWILGILAIFTFSVFLIPTSTVDARPGNAGRSGGGRISSPSRGSGSGSNRSSIITVPVPITRRNPSSGVRETVQSLPDVVGTTRFISENNEVLAPEITNEKLQKAKDISGYEHKSTNLVDDTTVEHIYQKRPFILIAIWLLLLNNPLALLFIGIFIWRHFHNKGSGSQTFWSQKVTRQSESDVIAKVQVTDHAFNSEQFKAHVKKAYMVLVNAWTTIDMTRASQYTTPAYAGVLTEQLQEFVNNKTRNVNEGLEFLNLKLLSYEESSISESIVVEVELSDIDYIVNEDNEIVEGNKNRQYVRLLITMTRDKGYVTQPFKVETHCKQCQAPLKLDISGKCAYCDTLHEVDTTQWLIDDVKV